MYITGYHGTTLEAADSIISHGMFNISTGTEQWLGNGIYFFPDFENALNWRYKETDSYPEAVVHVLIRLEKNEILDADSSEGIALLKEVCDYICSSANVKIPKGKEQENQCNALKMIWDKCKSIKMIIAKLPSENSSLPILIDYRKKHVEFCIRDNDPIVYKSIIHRGDIHD